MRPFLAVFMLSATLAPAAPLGAQEMKVALEESFAGAPGGWGASVTDGALDCTGTPVMLPLMGVRDCVVEFRARVGVNGLVEFMFRQNIDTDDYYIFRLDSRTEGGDPPGFLKRYQGTPPWGTVGERTGQIPLPDEWLQVRVEAEGDQFRGYVNGELVATLEDADFAEGGFSFRGQLAGGQVDDLRISVPQDSLVSEFKVAGPAPMAAPVPYVESPITARWIWAGDPSTNLDCVLRQRFTLDGAAHAATVVATCDNAYELYLNGQRVSGDEDWYSLEVENVTRLLKPGENVLAARCHNDGPGAAGLLVELGAVTEAGRSVHIISNATWKAQAGTLEGWELPELDDSGWGTASDGGGWEGSVWAGQRQFHLPYLGPWQPVELLECALPAQLLTGRPLEVEATWRPLQALTDPYPVALVAETGMGVPTVLATAQPATDPRAWAVGEEHTERLSFTLWPDAVYLLQPGTVRLGLELRGTFDPSREEPWRGEAALPALPATVPVAPRLATPVTAGTFTDPQGQSHAWALDEAGRMVVDGTAYLPVDEDGVYWCEADSAGEALGALDWQRRVRAVCERGGPSGADFVRVRLVDHVDATATDHEFSEDSGLGGKSRVMRIGDRDYRVSAARNRLSYFAYSVRCRQPRNPHVMMFQTVNDRERYTTLRIQPAWDNVGGGVYTGREYPCDGKPLEHRFIFYPREERIRFTISRMPVETPTEPESGAAVSHVWLFELQDPLASRPVKVASPDGTQRRLGMYLTHPVYLRTLYGYRGDNAAERQASLRSFVDYMRFCGLNLLEFNAVDGGDTTGTAFYDSEIWPQDSGNLLKELLPLCEAADIQVIPIITSLSVPEGKQGFTRDSFQMDRYGNLTTFFDSRPPLPDPLRPEVQDLLKRNLREILAQCAQSPAVPAVGFRVNGKIGLCYGGEKLGATDQYTGYSAWDVAQFEGDTGIDVPEMQPTPYEWIKANCWERWLQWRCERTRDLWLQCRDLVREYRPDLKLYISCDMPSETPAWNIYWPQGISPLECMRYHGVDPRMLANEPGILLQRGMMVAADRYFTRSGQYAINVEAMKAFHYAPGVTEMYNGAEGNACELYHNYWEEFGAFPMGEFRTNFWGAATMYAAGRGYFEPVTFSLAATNCHTLNLFSWERGTYGQEHSLRAFARAFRALPVGDGEDVSGWVSGDTQGLWVRRFGDRVAVLNATGQPRNVELRYAIGLAAGQELIEYGRGEVLSAATSDARLAVSVRVPLEAWDLRVLGAD